MLFFHLFLCLTKGFLTFFLYYFFANLTNTARGASGKIYAFV